MTRESSRKICNPLLLTSIAIALSATPRCFGQEPTPPPVSFPAAPPPAANPTQIETSPPEPASKKAEDPDVALDRAVREAGNDRAALIRKLEQYLERYPNATRKTAVYRALVESCEQLNDLNCALENAELLIANHPDDSEMMLVAVNLLDKRGDDESLARAGGYLTRVIDRVEKTNSSEKPARTSEADWQAQQNDLRLALHILRGKIERKTKEDRRSSQGFCGELRASPQRARRTASRASC